MNWNYNCAITRTDTCLLFRWKAEIRNATLLVNLEEWNHTNSGENHRKNHKWNQNFKPVEALTRWSVIKYTGIGNGLCSIPQQEYIMLTLYATELGNYQYRMAIDRATSLLARYRNNLKTITLCRKVTQSRARHNNTWMLKYEPKATCPCQI